MGTTDASDVDVVVGTTDASDVDVIVGTTDASDVDVIVGSSVDAVVLWVVSMLLVSAKAATAPAIARRASTATSRGFLLRSSAVSLTVTSAGGSFRCREAMTAVLSMPPEPASSDGSGVGSSATSEESSGCSVSFESLTSSAGSGSPSSVASSASVCC